MSTVPTPRSELGSVADFCRRLDEYVRGGLGGGSLGLAGSEQPAFLATGLSFNGLLLRSEDALLGGGGLGGGVAPVVFKRRELLLTTVVILIRSRVSTGTYYARMHSSGSHCLSCDL